MFSQSPCVISGFSCCLVFVFGTYGEINIIISSLILFFSYTCFNLRRIFRVIFNYYDVAYLDKPHRSFLHYYH